MGTPWYVVTLIMQCSIENKPQVPVTCLEQIHIIKAKNSELAYKKALQLGKSEEHSYKNHAGQNVSWEFVGMQNLEELLEESIHDGVEIRSRRLLLTDPEKMVAKKEGLTVFIAENIKNKTAEEILSE